MTEKEFQKFMKAANYMKSKSDNPEYWSNYIRGLRRKYHGEKFGTQEEHEKWLQQAGYEAGFFTEDIFATDAFVKVGRPELIPGECSVVLSVRFPKNFHDVIPEPKSEWVRNQVIAALKSSYCTQNACDCNSCSLSNYGRDCQNNPIETFH